MALDLNNLAYPFDPTGERLANKVTSEQHILRGSDYRDFYFFIPDMAPYFADSLVVSFKSNSGEVRELKAGIDYYNTHWFVAASLACAKPIFGSITILNRSLQGIATISYQTVGGDWVIPMDRIAAILADRLNNPRSTTWDRVAQMPYNFPVIDHEWNFADMVGEKQLVAGINGIERALLITGEGGIAAHIADLANPHQTTAAQVGLGLVRNLATATNIQAEAAVSDDVYMTPKSTMALAVAKIINPFNAHAANISNPHHTTAAQVGAYSIVEINQILQGKVDVTGVAADSNRFGGKLPAEFTAAVLTGTAANASKFGGQTPTELKTELSLMTVANANKVGGYTLAEIMATSTIYNAARFNGQTSPEFKTELLASTIANSLRLGGQTAAELMAAGTAGNSDKFAGRTIDQLKAEIGNAGNGGTSVDSLRFGGQLPAEFTASVLTGTAANATRLNGQTAAELMAAGTAGNASKFGGQTPAQYKEEMRLQTASNSDKLSGMTVSEIMSGNSGSTTTFGGMTADAFRNSILSGSVGNAVRFGNKTPAEFTEAVLAGTAANATKLNGRTDLETSAWILAGTAANAKKFDGMSVSDLDSRYRQLFSLDAETAGQFTIPGASGSPGALTWVNIGELHLPASGNKSINGDSHWMVSGGETITDGLKTPLYHLRLSAKADGTAAGYIHNVSDSTVPTIFGYSVDGEADGRIVTIWMKCTGSRTDITVTELSVGNGGITTFATIDVVEPAGFTALPISTLFASAADVEAAFTAMTAAFTALAQQLTA